MRRHSGTATFTEFFGCIFVLLALLFVIGEGALKLLEVLR